MSDKKNYPLQNIRNIGIIAHIDAGKTTSTEAILYLTGLTHKIGVVHDGNTTTDWMQQERDRGVTIVSSAITTFWRDNRINIIDTPGHVDFTAEVERSLRVLDGAVAVLDSKKGVEAQTETVFRQANKFKVPRVFALNKINQTGASFEKSLSSIHQKLTTEAYPIVLPIGFEKDLTGWVDLVSLKAYVYEEYSDTEAKETEIPSDMQADVEKYRTSLVEKIVEADDEALEAYLEGTMPSEEKIKELIKKSTIDSSIEFFPVLAGDFRGISVKMILDAVVDYLPSPLEVEPAKGTDPETGEEIVVKTDLDAPFTALAFKIITDPYVGRLVYFRVYSGSITSGSYVYNTSQGKKERLSRIMLMHADKREEVEEVKAGEIAAAVGLKDVTTGNTLCLESDKISLENIEFTEPVISMSIEPKKKADQEKMGEALRKLSQEDPTFHISTDAESKQTLISGVGEFQLEIKHDLLRTDYGVEATLGEPRVAFRETILSGVKTEHVHKKQSGGRGQYAHTVMEIEPLERGEGVVFTNKITGGRIPKEYIPSIEKGVRSTLENGIKYGYPMLDIEIKLTDGSFHEVDSSELAFGLCAAECIKEGAQKAGIKLLEPIMKVEITTPDEYMGDIIGDLTSRRGMIEGTEAVAGATVITGQVPLAEMFGYSTNLRSKSTGRATFSMEPSHYEVVPDGIVAKLKL